MSTLNPKTGEINWNTVPLENIEQIEVCLLYTSAHIVPVLQILRVIETHFFIGGDNHHPFIFRFIPCLLYTSQSVFPSPTAPNVVTSPSISVRVPEHNRLSSLSLAVKRHRQNCLLYTSTVATYDVGKQRIQGSLHQRVSDAQKGERNQHQHITVSENR